MKNVGIIGGGLAGLISAILLVRKGFAITLFEEKKYPFHRVCGEYISNEVIPFLQHHQLYPGHLNPVAISQFKLTAPSGKHLSMPLDLGGFGISRYHFDHWLSRIAESEGVTIIHDRVVECLCSEMSYEIHTRGAGPQEFDLVIGAFGKRSTMDKKLQRNFIDTQSPYVGVKYHLHTDEVDNRSIELHNFDGGYCGISRIEDGKFNLCYLTHRKNLKMHGSIPKMEEEILYRNPNLRRIFRNSEFLFDKPEVINEISFSPKEAVHNHILMTGDAAGMITPLCGNGMAMAIHSAKLLTELIISDSANHLTLPELEKNYEQVWKKRFARRLWAGRQIQQLFGAPIHSEIAVMIGKAFPPFTRNLMALTHGQPFS